MEKFTPTKIYTDYTSEKSFSEWLETHLHPAFANRTSSQYKKWKYIEPIIFSQPVKLNMKQNARQMMEEGLFVWPMLSKSNPKTAMHIAETKEQMLREAGRSGNSGTGMTRVHFPKPVGYDNDLIMALELALLGARKHLGHFGGSDGKPWAAGGRLSEYKKEVTPEELVEKNIRERLSRFNITDVNVSL